MERYESYKDSGVAWIGKVPEHWEVMKTSLLYTNIGSGTTPSTSKQEYYEDDGFCWLQTGDLNDGYITDTSKKISKVAIKDCKLRFYPVGSIVIAMYGATIGKIGLLKVPTSTNQACCVLPYSNKMNEIYTFYVCQIAKGQMLLEAVGGGQPNISQDIIKKLKLPVPPICEQQAIAAYLDKRCCEIDKAIATQQKRIALLQELKQSIITHAVTRGIHPDVPLKESGVEWIGKVPEHWDIKRMRFLCTIDTGTRDTIDKVDDGDYPFYVRSPKIERINTYTFDGEAVLMAGDGVGAGKVIHYANGKFDYHQRVYNIHNYKEIATLFAYYYLQSNFRYKIEEGGAKNTVDSVRLPWLKDFPVCITPQREQDEILTFIKKNNARINTLILKAERQIELLQELRQSVITEAITGKIKVC